MKTSFGVACRATRSASGLALAVTLATFVARAQPAPTNAPPPAEPAPTRGTEPPPALAPSPMLGGESPPPAAEDTPPPAPTYEAAPPPPPEEPPPPPPEEAPPKRSAGIFSRGSVRLSLLIGTGWTSTDEYLILGAGVGYYVLDGVELGLDYEAWLFGDPVFHRLSPGVRYVFHMIPVVKPYVGGFYRHTFVNDYKDLNYLGARAGLYLMPKPGGMFVGAGAVYEHLLNCPANSYVDCDDVYPEIFFGVSF